MHCSYTHYCKGRRGILMVEKFEFLKNGSYTYHVMGDVVLFHVTIRDLDENGNLIEKKTVDMLADLSLEDFLKKDLVTDIDGEIPEDFFPEHLWESEELDEEDYDFSNMHPIFECDGFEGTAQEIRGFLDEAQHQYFLGLREYCPQAILVMVTY